MTILGKQDDDNYIWYLKNDSERTASKQEQNKDVDVKNATRTSRLTYEIFLMDAQFQSYEQNKMMIWKNNKMMMQNKKK